MGSGRPSHCKWSLLKCQALVTLSPKPRRGARILAQSVQLRILTPVLSEPPGKAGHSTKAQKLTGGGFPREVSMPVGCLPQGRMRRTLRKLRFCREGLQQRKELHLMLYMSSWLDTTSVQPEPLNPCPKSKKIEAHRQPLRHQAHLQALRCSCQRASRKARGSFRSCVYWTLNAHYRGSNTWNCALGHIADLSSGILWDTFDDNSDLCTRLPVSPNTWKLLPLHGATSHPPWLSLKPRVCPVLRNFRVPFPGSLRSSFHLQSGSGMQYTILMLELKRDW